MSCPEYPKIDTLYERGDDFKVDESRIRRPEFLVPREWTVTEKVDGTNVRVSLEYQEGEAPPVGAGPRSEGDWAVRYYGRTEKSDMPTFLMSYLQNTFTLGGMQSLWRCKPSCECVGGWLCATPGSPANPCTKDSHADGKGRHAYQQCSPCPAFEPYPIVLYGEGYGARIQKGGGDYRKDGDVSCRLFDVLVSGKYWLSRGNVEDVARQLDVQATPLLSAEECDGLDVPSIVHLVHGGIDSVVAEEEGTRYAQAEGVVAFTDPPLFNSREQRLMWKLKTKDFA